MKTDPCSNPLRSNRQVWLLAAGLAMCRHPAVGLGANNPSPSLYPVMHFSSEEIVWMQARHRTAPQLTAPPVANGFGGPQFGGSQSLLSRLPYVPAERQQGQCGDCWQWASTGVLEIAHNVQDGISDRLSVQFINSCNTAKNCCDGGWIDEFAAFYAAKGFAIPWANADAAFSSGTTADCSLAPCAGIGTDPQYPIGSIQAVSIPTAGVGQAQAIANLKNALNQNKAMVFGFFLPDSAAWNEFDTWFANQPESAVWSNYHPGATYGTGGGGHAVLCVGYNDDDPANGYWIMVNSWGTTAGRPNGIFRVAMNLDYDCTLQSANGPIQTLEWATLDVQFSAAVPRLDHFGWNTISSPQGVSTSIPVTVSAQTAAGAVETNFAGTVSFRGFSGGGTSATLWSEGFESADLSDWSLRSFDYYSILVTTNTAAAGHSSLYMYGGACTPCDGISHPLNSITPSRINFCVGTTATNFAAAYFTVGNDYYGSNAVAFFTMGRDGTMGLYDGSDWHGYRYYANTWYKVSLVLDWATKTLDYYVNDSLVE
ncbi:MAG TPA: C1 family peptidase, partial [Verrucomicrobiae bacterium]|nr:C1 family peptidase [Verrucomicrobiae bacterium]